ncbi:Lin0368 family putative glycerol transporter subunit [Clostridium amazonitimonense]|uniref:Lin0368 family putative glycerol transporter subunit n=1 Tax=Clostridium amazonitimonense TaxID=1499689 RepID=UPI00050962C3|nr:hypothetical protein [Clostridium amazonitimonense]
MTLKAALATMCGGFIFSFLIVLLWRKLVDNFGVLGILFAAAFIFGTTWCINHGLEKPMIFQSGTAWVDMTWASGAGLLTASIVTGGKIKKALPNILCAIVGGILAGFILSLFL